MAGKYLVGVDIGTTGAKGIIFDFKGNIIASGYFEYSCEFPRPNWVEQDVDFIVEKAMDATAKAVADGGINTDDVAAISFSAQRCCTVFVDRDDKLVRPMISWQDNRAVGEFEAIKESIGPDDYYDITSLPINTTWMISKILWLRNNEPDNWKKTAKVVQLQDYALKAWGAEEFLEDMSDAGFSGLWDPYKPGWSDELLSLFDIPPSMFPKVVGSGTPAGSLSETAARRTGLKPGTPLVVGAGDQNSAAVGAGIVKKGFMSVSLGTGGLAAVFLDTPFRDPGRMSMVTNHAIEGRWQLEGLQAGAASVYKWFRDELAGVEKAYAGQTGKDVYEILNEIIDGVPPGAKGLVMLPYFASATTPRWNPYARGVVAGMSFAHDKACLARAFMEGITLEIKDMLQAMLASGVQVDNVHILGGPTKSKLWNQMQADMYNRPVKTLKITDAAPLGAAICGGVGIGEFKDIAQGAECMVNTADTYDPNPKTAGLYDELYEIFCKMYSGLEEKGVFTAITDFQTKYFD
jgi:xylulokinase